MDRTMAAAASETSGASVACWSGGKRLTFNDASFLRWAAFRAGYACVRRLAGGSRVEAHAALLAAAGAPSQAFEEDGATPQQGGDTRLARAAARLSAEAECWASETLRPGIRAGAGAAEAMQTPAAEQGSDDGDPLDIDDACLRSMLLMAKGCGLYWAHVAHGKQDLADRALELALREFHRVHWAAPPWRGANLGGWFLLEPGPASPFHEECFDRISKVTGAPPPTLSDESEHCLCKALLEAGGPDLRAELFAKHRRTHYSEETFDDLVAHGLNAVRLPLGYWTVRGPGPEEHFEGPCLELLDRAVAMAEARGLQVLLDLHGTPGGESGERPCGRVDHAWHWTSWRRQEAVEVLGELAARYRERRCVTGLQVCNEPSTRIPVQVLCGFYEDAVRAIRAAGMGPDRVAVVLPAFDTTRVMEVVSCWRSRGNFLKYDNVAFDIHYYHDFSPFWRTLSQAQHLDVVLDHARELALLPGAVVGEWSLARPSSSFSDEEMAEYAEKQVLAYNHSTHGWFFWNWHDFEFYPNWDMRRGLFGQARLPKPLGLQLSAGMARPDWMEDPYARVPLAPLDFWSRNLARLQSAQWLKGRVLHHLRWQ